MPLPLPNPLIYLGAVLRPATLNPHLRVPSISHVDWTQLRRDGYNAVVIDKDNCLTYPHVDSLHPSVTEGWKSLKAAFGPGNVLVVSNSAGTRSDRGGIAAESVSRELGVPVLLHARPKPGCSKDILDFFAGKMAIHSVSGQGWTPSMMMTEKAKVVVQETSDVLDEPRTLLGRQAPRQRHSLTSPTSNSTTPTPTSLTLTIPSPPSPAVEFRKPLDQPKVVVIGDRLATDVLLARRLALYLATRAPTPPRASQVPITTATAVAAAPSVVSIVTTSLFKKSDVRVLRWLEESWVRLGLAMSRRRSNGQDEGDVVGVQRWAANWALPHSVDTPPPVSPTGLKQGTLSPATTTTTPVVPAPTPRISIRTRISRMRATAKSYVSLDAWKAWFFAQIPTRARVVGVLRGAAGRAMSGLLKGGKRLLPTRVVSR